MKKQYQAPITRTVKLLHQGQLMAGSPMGRNISGPVTSNGMPIDVINASEGGEGLFNNGQDDGSIRSREFDWFE